ncbi:MAG: sensor histidine kinase [Clostridiales bacterium]|nr:sensor histidine kinase [Clostridiales bacterium]
MKTLFNKFVLIVCCFFTIHNENFDIMSVVALLTIISASSICQYGYKNKISLVSECVYIFLCFIHPCFIYYLPVLIYDIMQDKRYYFFIPLFIMTIYQWNKIEPWQFALILAISVISIVLQNRTYLWEKLQRELIETRDTSAELTMLLTEKNKHLRDNQDYEIYLATLKERNRIAREIHDNVGHLLSRSILQTGALKIVSKDETQKKNLEGLSETLNSAMTTIRNSVHDLHDDSVDLESTLKEAIKPLEENGIKTKTDFDFSKDLPNNIKFSFISIVKESISNIIKHSSCDTVIITLFEHPTFYQLIVEDNGKCSNIINYNGMGLLNIRERIESMGGLIQIDSNEKGFRIFITLRKPEGV